MPSFTFSKVNQLAEFGSLQVQIWLPGLIFDTLTTDTVKLLF